MTTDGEESRWIADRTRTFDSSGIRKVFSLASKLENPINLSIGQPDFDVPQPVKDSLVEAIQQGKNGYALTQGMPQLRDKLQASVDDQYGHADRNVFVCSGTSGGLVLAMLAMVNPGEEVLFMDPFFVMYESLIKLVGGVPVAVDSYPDFRPDIAKIEAAISPKTKMLIVNSPANPTGIQYNREEIRQLAELAKRHDLVLVSDEIYRIFSYDEEFVSPAEFNPETVVIDGFSKSYAMTGLRLGYVHGPQAIMEAMLKVQQYTFVCAPHPVQIAGATAMETDISHLVDAYRKKRDFVVDSLSSHYEISKPNGAFYVFPRLPRGTGEDFVRAAIEQNLLIIPGKIFSHRDSHFRISYAASDNHLDQGVEILKKLASV
ncbi:MAG: aminotransferase class I/II-fold pyridoxal phosphate-dependent enzyme [Planctomycetota bacterium]|nr:aminotransferase class I/II-fold pyridoxal phosphate-dependent enzyme [Planctomycetota bacterium]